MFDLNGRATTVAEWLDIIRGSCPGAQLQIAGEPLPFPADLSDEPIRAYLGDYGPVPLADGIEETTCRVQAPARRRRPVGRSRRLSTAVGRAIPPASAGARGRRGTR